MLLTKDGVSVEVMHPADIRRFKSLGYKEPIFEEEKPKRGRGKTETPDKDSEKEGEE